MALKCFVGDNFKVQGREELPTNSTYLNRPDVMFDERAFFISHNVNVMNWDWYFNYIDFTQTLVSKNPSARAGYFLNLGYIPIIYLPTCMTDIEPKLFEVLDVKKIPYAKMRKTSFVFNKVDLQGTDAWISKMDAAEILHMPPEKVTSEAAIRRILLNV